MRLLLWYWGRRGAGGQLTLSLAKALARRPDTALALSLSRQADLLTETTALGLPTDAVDTYNGAAGFLLGLPRVPSLARRLAAQARAHRAEAVVSVMTHLWTPLVAPALQRAGILFVPLVHDAVPRPGEFGLWWDWQLDRELDAAAMAVALSGAVEAVVRARRPGLPVARLPLGAHLPAEALRAAAPSGAAGDFLFFGRLRAYKGLDLLRDAFRLLRQRRPEARLRVVGGATRRRWRPASPPWRACRWSRAGWQRPTSRRSSPRPAPWSCPTARRARAAWPPWASPWACRRWRPRWGGCPSR